MTYLARLAARTAAVGSHLCLGIDPRPEALPDGFSRDLAGVERFSRLLLEAVLPRAAAVKANLAFFEAFGSAGIATLERLRVAVPADVPFIADAKRGDIGSTAERQAAALFDALGADAVTASPYLGREALEPLLAREDRFTYVLCRTSNAASDQVQGLSVDGEPLYLHIARLAGEWAAGRPVVGLVVGATAADELAKVRAAAPGLAFLVPGVGAQGGDVAAVLGAGRATAEPAGAGRGGGLVVNVSRGISAAPAAGEDVGEALVRAGADWAARLRC